MRLQQLIWKDPWGPKEKWMVPHTRNRKRLKVDLGQVNPETFQHAGHKSWGGGALEPRRSGKVPRATAPPTSRAILLGLLASSRAQTRDFFGPQTPPLRSRSAPSADGAPALPPSAKALHTDPPASNTPADSSPRGSRSLRPHTAWPSPSDQLPGRRRRPLTFSSPCQLSLSPWRCETPDT